MNLFIDIFICIAISTLLSVTFVFIANFLVGKYRRIENVRVGAAISMLIISCILNGIFICWLLIIYENLPSI